MKRLLIGATGLVCHQVLPGDADFWEADAAIRTLGTTLDKAGSRGRS